MPWQNEFPIMVRVRVHVTSNRERTLRLSRSGLPFSTSAVAISPHKFFDGTPVPSQHILVTMFLVTMSSTLSDSEMNVD